jgi:M6 family metalloprotease-like protein
MKKRLLITMTALMLVTVSMLAVPAKPGLKKMVMLKDGTTVELSLRGDEHFSYYVDATGNACQVVNGEMIKMTQEEVAQTWTARRAERMNVNEGGRASRRTGTPSNKTTGKQNGLVILMQFPDKSFVTSSPKQTFTRFFNEVGYSEHGMSGSVRDYFLAQSEDKLEINFDVVGPFTTKHNMAYYGKRYTEKGGKEQNDTLAQAMVAEAVDAAHLDGVDFSKYDWDNDGEVDQVFVIYAGYSEAQGAASETIWPHEWVLMGEYRRTYNGKKIYTYACAAELRGDGVNDTDHVDGIGTACHEFSHCLGLPDMYDTDGQENYGMCDWDVMDSGSYLDNSCTPAGFTSYERWFVGWKEPEEINSVTQIENMRPLAEKGSKTYVIYNKATRSQGIKGEYYLLENRQPVGFDKKLPGHGLLILHVDYDSNAWSNNKINSNKQDHQHLTIIAADNDYDYHSKRSLAGDPWPGVTGNTILGNNTTPAATLYRANTDGKKLMNMPISNITEDANAMTVSFVVGVQELSAPEISKASEQVEGNTVTITWNAVSGATGYELEVTAKDKKADYETSFDQCYSAMMGTKDISNSLKDYGLENWRGSDLYTSPKKLAIKPQGHLMTPEWKMPSSADITVVVGAESEGSEVSGYLYFLYVNEEDKYFSTGDVKDINVKGKETQLFHIGTVNADYYALYFLPDDQMYMNYLAVYQGRWTAEELGLDGYQSSQASRRAVSTETYSSSTNSYTFNNLDVNKVYNYRLRAIGGNGQYSGWSEERTLTYGVTGIQSISAKVANDNTVRYFDLQGREVSGDTKGLLIRKQGSEVKKVIVK